MSEVSPITLYEQTADPDANWNIRPDVAGYEYTDEGCNWRIGIVRDVMDSETGTQAVRDILETPFTDTLTRNMARVVVQADMLKNGAPAFADFLTDLEVLIDLSKSGNPALADCYQAIFSRNAPSRQTASEQIQREIEIATQAFEEGRAKFNPQASYALPEGISLHTLSTRKDTYINSFVELLSNSFADDAEDLEEGITGSGRVNVAAVTMVNGVPQVVCGAYAEEDADNLIRNGNIHRLKSYDVGAAKVRPDYANQGLYTALSAELYRKLAGKRNVDVVLGYSNATEPAVFKVAGKMGREIVTHTAQGLQLPIKPAIQQTVTDGKLVDEIVTYMPGNVLRSLYKPKPGAGTS